MLRNLVKSYITVACNIHDKTIFWYFYEMHHTERNKFPSKTFVWCPVNKSIMQDKLKDVYKNKKFLVSLVVKYFFFASYIFMSAMLQQLLYDNIHSLHAFWQLEREQGDPNREGQKEEAPSTDRSSASSQNDSNKQVTSLSACS